MTDNEIIKACPFCGGEAVIHNCAEVENESLKVVLTDKVGVHCKHCGIATSPLLGEETAIEAWNRRVDEEIINRQKAEIERLKAIVDSFTDIGKLYSEIKAEAVKEFAERLCKDRVSNDPVVIAVKVELKTAGEENGEI